MACRSPQSLPDWGRDRLASLDKPGQAGQVDVKQAVGLTCIPLLAFKLLQHVEASALLRQMGYRSA